MLYFNCVSSQILQITEYEKRPQFRGRVMIGNDGYVTLAGFSGYRDYQPDQKLYTQLYHEQGIFHNLKYSKPCRC